MIRLINAGGYLRRAVLMSAAPQDFSGWLRERQDSMSPALNPTPSLPTMAAKNMASTFINDNFENCSLRHEWYDVVTLWGTHAVLLHPLRSFEQLALALKPSGLLAMNVQDFHHWIRRIFSRLMTGWNVMFNLSSRSLNVLMQQLDFAVIDQSMERQLITLDHLFRVLRLRGPSVLRPIVVKVPAVSYPVVICAQARVISWTLRNGQRSKSSLPANNSTGHNRK